MAENALTRGLYQAKIGPTPRNALLGGIADALRYVDEGANVPDPTNPQQKGRKVLSFISNALGIGDLAAVADRASYGLPQTQGTGFARQMLPETRNALAGAFPAAIAKPQTAARMAMSALTNGLDGGALNKAAIVWHGSPHKFDKFDSSKIGTGEGAQAYGHGLYLAESKDLADVYRKKLTGVDGAAVSHPDHSLQVKIGQLQNQIQQLRRSDNPAAASMIRAYENRIAELNSAGNLYKVDLPDPMIARMLDWDKPLSQQAHLIDVVRKERPGYMQMSPGGTKASDAYMALADSVGHDKAAQMFRQAGIPGIRYLDGGSRGAGAGTSNFVVFPGEENALTILQRNGQPIR